MDDGPLKVKFCSCAVCVAHSRKGQGERQGKGQGERQGKGKEEARDTNSGKKKEKQQDRQTKQRRFMLGDHLAQVHT